VTNGFNAQKVAENQEAGSLAGYVGMRAAGDIEAATGMQNGGAGAIALHTVVGGAAAALGGDNALQGALGAGASEAVSNTMSDYLANHGIDPNSTAGQSLMNLSSAIIGGAVGGGAGASTALAGEQFNRQLHPSEQQLAQTLAANSNGQYTTQQIEDAMRLSGYSLGANSVMPGETAQTGTLVNVNDSSSIYDTNASWQLIAGPNGSQYLMQVVPLQVSPDLAAYVIANTGGADSPYAWAPEQEGLPSVNETLQALSNANLGTRALGGLQMLGGELESIGGIATASTCETGFGCVAAMYLAGAGLDNATAGANTLSTGQPTPTFGQQGFEALGLSPQEAALLYGSTQLVPAGIEAYAANSAANAQAAANQLALASYQPFVTNGIAATSDVMATPQAQALIAQIQASNPAISYNQTVAYVAGYIESGSALPAIGTAAPGAALLKAVPSGQGVSSTSGYWMSPQQAVAIASMDTNQASQYLGLPASQYAMAQQNGFDFYLITTTSDSPLDVFVSKVAPTSQGSIITNGGAEQIIVGNRKLWSSPVQVNPFTLKPISTPSVP